MTEMAMLMVRVVRRGSRQNIAVTGMKKDWATPSCTSTLLKGQSDESGEEGQQAEHSSHRGEEGLGHPLLHQCSIKETV